MLNWSFDLQTPTLRVNSLLGISFSFHEFIADSKLKIGNFSKILCKIFPKVF